MHPPDDIYERVQLVIDFPNDLLMVCDEFLMPRDKFGVLPDAELMVCNKFGVLFNAAGGFCFEMRHHDQRILHFFPRGFQASDAFFVIVLLAVAVVLSHVLRLAHDSAKRQRRLRLDRGASFAKSEERNRNRLRHLRPDGYYTNSPAREIMLPATIVA